MVGPNSELCVAKATQPFSNFFIKQNTQLYDNTSLSHKINRCDIFGMVYRFLRLALISMIKFVSFIKILLLIVVNEVVKLDEI